MLNSYSSVDKVLLAVDCIIFGFDAEGLKILLIKRDFEPEKGKWSLIGGFLKKEESLDDAAIRILSSCTGLHDIYMEQLHSYSEIDRDPVERTISVAYYALINIENHNEELIQNHLYTAGIPDPELMIRTSGEIRISNFLLWQLAYTEFFITQKLWPDFRKEDLYEAICSYQHRERRFGKIAEPSL